MATPSFKETVARFNMGDYIRMSVLGGAGALVAGRLARSNKTPMSWAMASMAFSGAFCASYLEHAKSLAAQKQ